MKTFSIINLAYRAEGGVRAYKTRFQGMETNMGKALSQAVSLYMLQFS